MEVVFGRITSDRQNGNISHKLGYILGVGHQKSEKAGGVDFLLCINMFFVPHGYMFFFSDGMYFFCLFPLCRL